jgi:hypothetical protein
VSTAEIISWAEPAGFGAVDETIFDSPPADGDNELAVALWTTRLTRAALSSDPARNRNVSARADLEVAS